MPGRTVGKDGPHPVDVHVGSRLRMRRTLLGMSQGKVAAALGLTFQQLQKNERGANRIGSSRLYELSKILDVPVSFFFEEMDTDVESLKRTVTKEPDAAPDPMAKRETLELVRAYYRIKNPAIRDKIRGLAKSMAN